MNLISNMTKYWGGHDIPNAIHATYSNLWEWLDYSYTVETSFKA